MVIITNLLICFLSGIATFLGFFACYLKVDKVKLITFTLAFASGMMFFISIFELIPEGITMIISKKSSCFLIGIFSLSGLLIAKSLNGIIKDDNQLYKLGLYTSLGLIIHNLLEGFVTYLTLKTNSVLGLKLAISIALHNIPEGLAVAIPIFHSQKKNSKIILHMLVLSLSEIIGALIAFFIFKDGIKIVGELYLVIAGIMTYIAIFELFKESIKSKLYKLIIKSIISSLIIVLILKLL